MTIFFAALLSCFHGGRGGEGYLRKCPPCHARLLGIRVEFSAVPNFNVMVKKLTGSECDAYRYISDVKNNCYLLFQGM